MHGPILMAQEVAPGHYIDISKVQTEISLAPTATFETYERNSISDKDIKSLKISQKISEGQVHVLPSREVQKEFVVRFLLENSADSAVSFYFFPGHYCKGISLFKVAPDQNPSQLERVSDPPVSSQKMNGYAFASLGPKERAIFYARIEFTLSSQNLLYPTIIRTGFISYFQSNQLGQKDSLNIFNYVTAGILLMMIIYAASTYFQDYQIEFLYYAIYALSLTLLLFLKSCLFGSTTAFNYLFEGCLDFIIQLIAYTFYLLFIRKFLATKTDHPWLEKFLSFCNNFTLLSILAFGFFYFLVENYLLSNLLENIIILFVLGFNVVFIMYGFWKKDPLMNYMVAGQFLLTFFASIYFLLTINTFRFSKEHSALINEPLLYLQIGLIFELVFFMSGLAYKNKRSLTERVKEGERLKLENERKEFEKQVAILEAKQQERNRISADMHDELGSGVTAIRLMSEIVKTKMKEYTLPEIDKISHSANELLGKMNTIIWTMVSSNDTVESLAAYIRAYAVEFFESTKIDCQFNFPIIMPPLDLSGEKRRNIFLAVKEALNNVLKHSRATVVMINISLTDKLVIEIADNGIGINMDQLRKFGNGLHNMKRRIASIGGEFNIRNHQGTKTVFELELD